MPMQRCASLSISNELIVPVTVDSWCAELAPKPCYNGIICPHIRASNTTVKKCEKWEKTETRGEEERRDSLVLECGWVVGKVVELLLFEKVGEAVNFQHALVVTTHITTLLIFFCLLDQLQLCE